MKELAEVGGGTSRFISGDDVMKEVFGSGLAGTTVPVARDVLLTVTLSTGTTLLQSRGAAYRYVGAGRLEYRFPTFHAGDYETILLEVLTPKGRPPGAHTLLTVGGQYVDHGGARREMAQQDLAVDIVEDRQPTAGYSDAVALKAGVMLQFATAIWRIGLVHDRPGPHGAEFFLANDVRKNLLDAKRRLNDSGLDKQIGVLESYMVTHGRSGGLREDAVRSIIQDQALLPPVPDRAIDRHLKHLFREVAMGLEELPSANVAVSAFTFADGRAARFLGYLNGAAESQLLASVVGRHRIVERRRLADVLKEQELALSDLGRPDQAVRIGRFLAARYLLTGTVVETPDAEIVFTRLINVETAVIEAAAQVIVPRSVVADLL